MAIVSVLGTKFSAKNFLLRPGIMASILAMQLYETLMVLLLKYLLCCDFPKCLSMRARNIFPTGVLTVSLCGGLNQIF